MKIERRLGIRSAYGQLVFIVFLPIAILAMVGGVLVFFETKRALQSEQDALAQSALIRYEPIIEPLLPNLHKNDHLILAGLIQELQTNRMNALLVPNTQQNLPANQAVYDSNLIYQVSPEQYVRRVAILDKDGIPVVSIGYSQDERWAAFDVNADSIWRLPTAGGTAYGMPLSSLENGKQMRYWLFVEMDNEPIVIAYYRILLALAITGLTTILLLLLILSIYSKRWIAPIYELRLFLQKLTPTTLHHRLTLKSDGEFTLLQKEINHALVRLNDSFQELKAHSEQTEADLQQAFDEMEMQTISIRRANNLLKHTSDTKSAFLATISHELRTPLNAIDGFINLLARSENLDNKQALYVQTIKKSSAHLLALINDVLDFSKIEAGKLILEHQEFNLHHSILEVADMLSPTAYDKGLRMAVLYYNDVPALMMGDKLRVKQILTNLIGNALKFTDTGDVVIKVVLNNDKNDEFVRLMVIDAGNGIDKAVGEQLFQSFSQGDVSITRRYGGTGLGLLISKQLTEMMGGEIGFFDNPSENIAKRGATFWFDLPITMTSPEILDNPISKKGTLLSWINHEQSQLAVKMTLAGSPITLHTTDSLAKFLDALAQNGKEYDWVIVDSHAQKGDLEALLGQVRRYYDGQVFVFGYQIGLNDTSLAKHNAHALYEPLDSMQLHQLIDNQYNTQAPRRPKWDNATALIVDDTEANLLVLEALLQEFGITSIKANSGFEAIERMSEDFGKDNHIQLIFMDISMPVMSGVEACRAIRRLDNPTAKTLPIIALTAHSLPDDMSELTKAGLSDYATKPLSEQELLLLLQKWLSPDLAPPDNQLSHKHDTTKAPPDFTNTTLLPILDEADGLARAGGKAELANKLLILLLDSLTDEKELLINAWTTKHLSQLADTVHRLLGASRYTGVPMLRHSLEMLHDKAVRVKTEAALEWTSTLTQDYQAVIDAIDKLISTTHQPEKPNNE